MKGPAGFGRVSSLLYNSCEIFYNLKDAPRSFVLMGENVDEGRTLTLEAEALHVRRSERGRCVFRSSVWGRVGFGWHPEWEGG